MGKTKRIKIKSKLTDKEKRELSAPPGGRELALISAGVRIVEAVLKTVFTAAFVLCFLALFSCASVYGYSEPEDRFAVSSLGFDREGESFLVSARAVTGKDEEARVFIGSGETVDSAMAHIKGADEKGLELSHLAVIVVGDGIGESGMDEIFDYCRRNGDITVGVRFAAAHSARDLIGAPEGDGYKLTGALRSGKDGSGYARGCRFYEIGNSRLDGKGDYHLPYFSEWEEGYTLDGLKIYTEKGATVRLDRSESAYYMMVKGSWDGGAADLEYGGREYSIYVSDCETELREAEDRIYVECTLELDPRRLPTDDTDGLMKSCSERATELCRRLTERYGDLLGLYGRGEIHVEMILK